ncbi:hypothetical protein T03_18018 [Trichinella britovi]|uniref:Uncharacterized protein n=2 Tax=Trichinella TaxID=6333 RepID=A0A0V1CLU8_TRIBR|nr:hypothetical protein T05_15721 [Trichinella murrelli]KRX59516.1 hypothetical protein T09_9917 [Trichinella sp. T9]KRY50277.1 hypothetical protein T03_18018 [Trichinella britovi]
MRYREESGGQEHSDFSSCFLMLGISRFQSQLTGFPMYRLAEVDIRAVSKSQILVSGLKPTSKAAALLIKAWDLNPYVPMSLSVHKQ